MKPPMWAVQAAVSISILGVTLSWADSPARLFKDPDIDCDRIVFTCESDLWTVPVCGGPARRLTSHPGSESSARFSPDGRWIAFTAEYEGNPEIYVMPSEGGEPKRLTFHPSQDRVVEWTPDGRWILFQSTRSWKPEAFMVSVEGGPARKAPLDAIRHASYFPDGTRIAYTRLDSDQMHWNGYRGGAQQDIWLADLSKGTFRRIVDSPAMDNSPMAIGDRIVFNSDQKNGRMNLYALTLKDGSVKPLTRFQNWDVESPAIGQDRIVFVCEGRLWTLDLNTEKSEPMDVEILSDRWLVRETSVDPSLFVQGISLSFTGDKAVVEARGDVYVITASFTANLTRTNGSRERLPALSPDGRTLAFFSDRTGEYELYTLPLSSDGPWTPLTQDFKSSPLALCWSPDSRKLLFVDATARLTVVDAATKKIREIGRSLRQKDNEIQWQVPEFAWSPDSKWIVWSRCEENMNSTILLHNLESGTTVPVTDDRYDNTSPAFDTNGRFLYFLSLRNFEPLLDPFMDNVVNLSMSMAMVVPLQAGQRLPFGSETGDSFSRDPSFGAPLDVEGIQNRIFSVPIPAGTYKRLLGSRDGFTFLSRTDYGFPGWWEFIHPLETTEWSLLRYRLHDTRVSEVIHGIGDYALSGNGEKIAYRAGLISGVIDPDGERIIGEGSLDWHGIRQTVDPIEEYAEIFRDVWRTVRDFFYDPAMHGRDWAGILKKYEPLVRTVASRYELDEWIGRMIGELTVSHEYILESGDETRTLRDRSRSVGVLGADLVPDPSSRRYRFDRILKGCPWDPLLQNPLAQPHVPIREGDFLLAMDGRELFIDEDPLCRLLDRTGRDVSLTFGRTPDMAAARACTVKAMSWADELAIRQWDRTEAMYRTVHRAAEGRLGYIALSDMDEAGLGAFEQGFRAERTRDGLIIDVRDNAGGFVSWFLIDKLERKLTHLTKTRDFFPMRYPHGVLAGPVVFLCNEGTSSDGEAFLAQVQERKLGTLIGTRTWGGLVGIINTLPALDGGIVTQSNVGFADLRGRWIVENEGVIPDIVVENRPEDILAGRDRQLEKAIEVVSELIRRNPPLELKVPPFPDLGQ